MRIGVLSLQGDVREHLRILKSLNIDAVEVKYKEEISSLDGLIIPGGESTAIGKILRETNLGEYLYNKINSGLCVYGTCAGMVLLAKKIKDSNITHIPVIDIEVSRNAYGRQLSSFIKSHSFKGLKDDFEMVFIRAPYITKANSNVEVLSILDSNIVAAKQNNILVTSFHPELTKDTRIHEYFIDMIKNKR